MHSSVRGSPATDKMPSTTWSSVRNSTPSSSHPTDRACQRASRSSARGSTPRLVTTMASSRAPSAPANARPTGKARSGRGPKSTGTTTLSNEVHSVRLMRVTRWPRVCSAPSVWLPQVAVSPAAGMCPSSAHNRPAAVSQSPAGRSVPSRSLSSAIRMRPLTCTVPSPRGSTRGSLSPCSSVISPMSSSSRSSRLTSPAVPPYSSTTIAIWKSSSRISASSSATRVVSGTKCAGHSKGRTGSPPRSASRASSRSRAWAMPAISSIVGSRAGRWRRPASTALSSASRTVAPAGMVTMSGRGTITSRTVVSPKWVMEGSVTRDARSGDARHAKVHPAGAPMKVAARAGRPGGPQAAQRWAPRRAGAVRDRSVWDPDERSLLLLWCLTR